MTDDEARATRSPDAPKYPPCECGLCVQERTHDDDGYCPDCNRFQDECICADWHDLAARAASPSVALDVAVDRLLEVLDEFGPMDRLFGGGMITQVAEEVAAEYARLTGRGAQKPPTWWHR